MPHTYWNDLKGLRDISEELEVEVDVKLDNEDIDDFKETISYFIDDWVNSNIDLYKEYKFEQIMYEAIYEIVVDAYWFVLDDLNLDLEATIFDAIEIYFYKNDSFN